MYDTIPYHWDTARAGWIFSVMSDKLDQFWSKAHIRVLMPVLWLRVPGTMGAKVVVASSKERSICLHAQNGLLGKVLLTRRGGSPWS